MTVAPAPSEPATPNAAANVGYPRAASSDIQPRHNPLHDPNGHDQRDGQHEPPVPACSGVRAAFLPIDSASIPRRPAPRQAPSRPRQTRSVRYQMFVTAAVTRKSAADRVIKTTFKVANHGRASAARCRRGSAARGSAASVQSPQAAGGAAEAAPAAASLHPTTCALIGRMP